MLRIPLLASFLAVSAMLGACSSTPENPPPDLAAARVAINSADMAEVNRYAAIEMEQARQELGRAEVAWNEEEVALAERHAAQALASVRLAEAKVDQAQAREAEQDVNRTLQTLQDEVAVPNRAPARPGTATGSAPLSTPLPSPVLGQ